MPTYELPQGPGAGARLHDRLAGALPKGFLELEALLGLGDVVVSREVPTAAIRHGDPLVLLVNPDFVAEHVLNDAELAVLVLHEIHHVVLGHCRSVRDASLLRNVAQDAVINALICRRRPAREVRSLFERLYQPDTLPGALLRPPPGWPVSPKIPRRLPETARRVLTRLYPSVSPQGMSAGEEGKGIPTSEEVLELLLRDASVHRLVLAGIGKGVPLLGTHGGRGAGTEVLEAADDGEEGLELDADVVEHLKGSWERGGGGFGRSRNGLRITHEWSAAEREERVRQDLRRALLRATQDGVRGLRRRGRELRRLPAAVSVPLPHRRDRTAWARARLLGAPPLLYRAPIDLRVRVISPGDPVHVYLDVSGSMEDVRELLAELLRPLALAGKVRLFVFSTEVHPVTLEELRHRRFRTTGGTRVVPALEHWLAERTVRRALVLTDGMVESIPTGLVERLEREHRELHLVLSRDVRFPWARRSQLVRIASAVTRLKLAGEGGL